MPTDPHPTQDYSGKDFNRRRPMVSNFAPPGDDWEGWEKETRRRDQQHMGQPSHTDLTPAQQWGAEEVLDQIAAELEPDFQQKWQQMKVNMKPSDFAALRKRIGFDAANLRAYISSVFGESRTYSFREWMKRREA